MTQEWYAVCDQDGKPITVPGFSEDVDNLAYTLSSVPLFATLTEAEDFMNSLPGSPWGEGTSGCTVRLVNVVFDNVVAKQEENDEDDD